jgi:tetratricopeptide (TPR) repeat protein
MLQAFAVIRESPALLNVMWFCALGADAIERLLPDEALAWLGEAIERHGARPLSWPVDRICFGGMLARWYAVAALARGELDECEALLETALAASLADDLPIEAGRALLGLAEVAKRGGEHEQAGGHLDRAGELFSRNGAKLHLDQVLVKKLELRA